MGAIIYVRPIKPLSPIGIPLIFIVKGWIPIVHLLAINKPLVSVIAPLISIDITLMPIIASLSVIDIPLMPAIVPLIHTSAIVSLKSLIIR